MEISISVESIVEDRKYKEMEFETDDMKIIFEFPEKPCQTIQLEKELKEVMISELRERIKRGFEYENKEDCENVTAGKL